jgi:predicted 3-demethylubiquinone-9 3-methyltransferase (glyoxalase superfamily)
MYWEKLGEGGEEGRGGRLKDRFGLSWQIVPRAVTEMLAGPDKDRAARVMKAMSGMTKLDVQALENAARE